MREGGSKIRIKLGAPSAGSSAGDGLEDFVDGVVPAAHAPSKRRAQRIDDGDDSSASEGAAPRPSAAQEVSASDSGGSAPALGRARLKRAGAQGSSAAAGEVARDPPARPARAAPAAGSSSALALEARRSPAARSSRKRSAAREESEEDYEEEEDEDEEEEEDEEETRPSRRSGRSSSRAASSRARGRQGRGAARGEDGDCSEEDRDAGSYVLGGEDCEFRDFSRLKLKPDHMNRPLWVCPDGRIFLETFSPVYKQAYDFLIACAEPVSRPESVHEYALTPHSLYAAVSIGVGTGTILAVLERLSKCVLPAQVKSFVLAATDNYGKVKLVLKKNAYYVESSDPAILRRLLRDKVIAAARVLPATGQGGGNRAGAGGTGASGPDSAPRPPSTDGEAASEREEDFIVSAAPLDVAARDLAATQTLELRGEEEPGGEGTERGPGEAVPASLSDPVPPPADALHAFEVDPRQVEHVKARCLPGNLNFPMLEEYDFANDAANASLEAELKPAAVHRPYQEKSLSKMFGNGRARSGVIVLPCGAGKSLVGVSAAIRVGKSALCLCTNSVSVDQWRYQFQLWSTLRDDQIARFTSERHEWFAGAAGVAITTYTMLAYSGKRSASSEKVLEALSSREWGLIILDEVHVVPAAMFRRVLGLVKAHAKLGLTATLVREDALIADLNFLIGPKLYEANWLDLTKAGHIARVQCAEVWCPMTREFMGEYLRPGQSAPTKALLWIMNPAKLRAAQFLVRYHERRGDKVIVFSDNIHALREYAVRMRRPFVYGGTGHAERTRVLHAFKHSPAVNTVFLSKVGDNSLDIPEANVLIQIASHGGSRRQEAQRLGRILRKKKSLRGAAAQAAGAAPDEEFDAFFYTLVSTDTHEVFFTAKRQQFLIDQGYAYKVIPQLLDAAGAAEDEELLVRTREEQLDVLAAVLAATDGGLEDDGVKDDISALQAARRAKRMAGSLAKMSGADDMHYMEFSTRGEESSRRGRAVPRGGGRLAKLRKKHAEDSASRLAL